MRAAPMHNYLVAPPGQSLAALSVNKDLGYLRSRGMLRFPLRDGGEGILDMLIGT